MKKSFLTFDDAKNIIKRHVIKYKIINRKAWHYSYIKNGNKPKNIPSNPDIVYKNLGWIGWGDWLGTGNIRGSNAKYTVNNDFFKTWNSDMAYIFGFWFADGNIRRRKERKTKCFSIFQKRSEKGLLEEMLKRMSCDNKIYDLKTRDQCSFEIISSKIYEDVIKLGGRERKSRNMVFPRMPEEYNRDFIRGFFDGDGCVYCVTRNNKYFSYISSISYDFLSSIQSILLKNNIKSSIYWIDTCYRLTFGIKNTVHFGKYMYNDIGNKLFMKRKYEKFLNSYDKNGE